jgi:FtsP/CotA-like multicopper oxidase with cupredoxin domain
VLRLAGASVASRNRSTRLPGAPITVDDLRGGDLEIGRLVYEVGARKREKPLPEPRPLPDNPISAKLDVANALKLDVPLDGGSMGMMMGRGMGGMGMGGATGPGRFQGYGVPPQQRIWALAGVSATGHDGPPMFKVERGRTVVLNFANRAAFPHAMHVHGHHFRQVDQSGEGWRPYWLDTVIVDVDRAEQIAFVANNPGKWMMHCHMIEHMAAGMAAWFQVT